ncbi:MAG: hypothetical protein ACI9T7_003229 [Oleiphilaceae bacterium]|jgi:hypothetical protein
MIINYFKKPKGPNFSKADPVSLTFSGTKVNFMCPGYSYQMIDQDEEDKLPTDINLYDFKQYKSVLFSHFDEPYNQAIDIAAFGCFHTKWGFRKGLLGNKYDEGTFSFTLSIRHITRFGSLFKPQNMERAVIEALELSFGPKGTWAGEGCGGRRYRGPEDWKIQHSNTLNWLHYCVTDIVGGDIKNHVWCIPISEEHFISFRFRDTGYSSNQLIEAHKVLAEQVVSSCRIEYSPDALAQMDKAVQEGLGEPYSEHREPLAWEEYDLEPERFERKEKCY